MQPDIQKEVDHINHIRNDNRLENLRWTTHNKNKKHKKLRNGSIGVCFNRNRGKWIAYIEVDGDRKNIGSFNTKIEAQLARDE